MKTYYVYMVQCFDGTFYVGVTNDIERRYGEQLSYVGEFGEINDAIGFEKIMVAVRIGHPRSRCPSTSALRAYAQGDTCGSNQHCPKRSSR